MKKKSKAPLQPKPIKISFTIQPGSRFYQSVLMVAAFAADPLITPSVIVASAAADNLNGMHDDADGMRELAQNAKNAEDYLCEPPWPVEVWEEDTWKDRPKKRKPLSEEQEKERFEFHRKRRAEKERVRKQLHDAALAAI